MRNFDSTYMRMAQIWASNSYAQRNKVGALIVKDGMIISDGFNGTPSGFENECEEIVPCGNTEILKDRFHPLEWNVNFNTNKYLFLVLN